MKRAKYDEVMKTATEAKPTWAIHDKLRFHYFNPNGLVSEKTALDAKISSLVDKGIAKSGAIIAYGSLDLYYFKKMQKLHEKKRVSRREYIVFVSSFRDRNERARKYIESVSAV